jgi:hypothetical protein
MPDEIGKAAKQALAEFTELTDVSQNVPHTSFDKQLAYLEKSLGKKQAIATVGTTARTWGSWTSGRKKPTRASQNKVQSAYDTHKRPGLIKLRRTLAAKKRITSVRIQISGTAQISDKSSYRTNFSESDLVNVDLSNAWIIRTKPTKLAEYFTTLIQDRTGVEAYWPEPDVSITLIG